MDGRTERDPVRSTQRAYEKPAVIQSEKVLTRRVTCISADEPCGVNGPLSGS